MRKGISSLTIAVVSSLLLWGCSSTPEKEKSQPPSSISLPREAADPNIEGRLASNQCVPLSEDFAGDRAEATALARADLAKAVAIKLKGIDDIYKNSTRAGSRVSKGSNFEMTQEHIVDLTMAGSRVAKVNIVDINKVPHVCSTVALSESDSRKIFEEYVGSGIEGISAQDERILWKQFKASQAQERLDERLR